MYLVFNYQYLAIPAILAISSMGLMIQSTQHLALIADCFVNLDSLAIPAILAILAILPGLTDGSIFR
jgi:hypothetical protein